MIVGMKMMERVGMEIQITESAITESAHPRIRLLASYTSFVSGSKALFGLQDLGV